MSTRCGDCSAVEIRRACPTRLRTMSIQKPVLLPYVKYQTSDESFPSDFSKSLQSIETTKDTVPNDGTNGLTIGDILDALPKRYRQKAAAILNHMPRDHTLTWNGRGQLVYKGTTIPRSNFVDLLKDTQYHHKNFTPVASTDFYQGIKEIHLPTTLLVRRDTPERNLRPPWLIRGKKRAEKSGLTCHEMERLLKVYII